MNLRSDPTDPETPSAPYDHEGMPLRPQQWIEAGRAKELHVSRFWGQKKDAKPTGSHHVYRLSGGRIVPVGPGVVCLTIVVPVVDWLDPAGKSLRPEQILNRAVRPLLAMLRAEGLDAFPLPPEVEPATVFSNDRP